MYRLKLKLDWYVLYFQKYIHTVRHLKLKQLIYRVFYRVRRLKLSPSLKPNIVRIWHESWLAPEVMPSAYVDENKLVFLGEAGCLDENNLWNSPIRSKLWLYNLHYFDVMSAVNALENQKIINTLLHRWIQENPPITGNGWEPYPLSLRIVNWVKWLSKYPEYANEASRQSLALQGAALVKQLEYHILGNHLFANAKALVFIGSYFDGPAATSWLAKGIRLLDREIPEQFLLDGGHFERSPMYHATLLWDMCDLYNLALRTGIQDLVERKAQWEGVIQRGLVWLACMTHPDGDVSFFNDSTFGIAPKLHELETYAKQLGIIKIKTSETSSKLSHQYLKNTGYGVVNLPKQGKLIVDVGEVGPDYQPGHAHADTLSFELSLFGERLVVNSGISEYGESELRQAQRGTKAHATVQINDENSSDVWSGFRVAQRAHPVDVTIDGTSEQIIIGCGHDGYMRLPSKNMHHRTWTICKNKLTVEDRITGSFKHARARFYLHPQVKFITIEHREVLCCLPSGERVKIYLEGTGDLSLVPANWYCAFNRAEGNTCIMVSFVDNKITMQFEWPLNS